VALGNLNNTLGWFLVIAAVLNTLFSLYYYVRIVVQMALYDDGRPELTPPLGGIALVNVCAVALLALFVFAQPLKNAADRFTKNLNPTTATTAAAQRTIEGTFTTRD
jgi:NADH:ubiquinone oxidoreductase subunit 2 (subunit N)